MKKKLLVVALTVVAVMMAVAPVLVSAQDGEVPVFGGFTEGANLGALGGDENTDLKVTIAKVMQWILGFLGIIAVLIILYGGFVWMTAGGDTDKVGKAKQILISGIIGLIIILAAWMIASFVFTEANTLINGGDL